MEKRKLNLLYIMTDHQRFDSIGKICKSTTVAPNLTVLSRESTFFTRAYDTCPLCVPARTALATGIYPTANHVVYNDWKGKTATRHATLQKILKDNGYFVGHAGVDHIRSIPRIEDSGLDFYYSQKDYAQMIESLGIPTARKKKDSVEVSELVDGKLERNQYSGTNVSEWKYPLYLFKDRCFLDKSLEFLDSCTQSNPFALFVCFWAPHPPLTVPEEYLSKFPTSDIVLPSNIGICSKNEPSSFRRGIAAQLAKSISKDEWRNVWSAHFALTNMVDEYIGVLIDKIKSLGLYDDTVIVFTSDHGDNLGQHSMYQKMEMYEEDIHVPLIIKVPGVKASKPSTVVSHLDVVPTLCDLFGLGKLDPMADGKSLIYEIESGKSRTGMESFAAYSGNPGYGDVRRAIITDRYKLIVDDACDFALFDLIDDPLEMNNIAHDSQNDEIVKKLYERCMDYHLNKNDYFEWRCYGRKMD